MSTEVGGSVARRGVGSARAGSHASDQHAPAAAELLPDKAEIAAHYDRLAEARDRWRRRNSYYHETVEELCRAFVPAGRNVLELGSATGDLLASLRPRRGVGVDLSALMCEVARAKYPGLEFVRADAERLPLEEQFEAVVASDLVGSLSDVWDAFSRLHRVCAEGATVVVTSYNFLWQPALALAERLGLKMPQPPQNWLGFADLENIFRLTDFEIVESGTRLLVPARLPLARRLNRRLTGTKLLKHFGLLNYFVLRPARAAATAGVAADGSTCTVVVPCRNEVGNIAACVERTPLMGPQTEIVFVDGDSTDGTVAEIERQIELHRGRREIRLIHQVPREAGRAADAGGRAANLMLRLGKGDAVRKGFAAASGEILMILDADLTVPPEDLPKFYDAIARGKGELVNGTRLVYPLEDESMKALNFAGNKVFSWLFTWLLSQRIKDTLCGTKVLRKSDYERIAAARHHFGDFDPFGDFDLLFGAARLGLRIVEMPVRYRRRTSGETKVRAFRHGLLLARMCAVAFRRFKLQPLLARLRRGGDTSA